MNNTHENIERIALDVVGLVEKKNNDYNHAFEKDIKKYGPVAYAIMIDHKLSRFHSLAIEQQQQMVGNESLEDTIKDIIGYSLNMLEIMERDTNEYQKEIARI